MREVIEQMTKKKSCIRCKKNRHDRVMSDVNISEPVCKFGMCHVGDEEIIQQIHVEKERKTQPA